MLHCDFDPATRICRNCGFDEPNKDPSLAIHRECDVLDLSLTYEMAKLPGAARCGGCDGRKQAMNAVIPGSGDLAEKAIDLVTFGQGKKIAAALSRSTEPEPVARPALNIINRQGFGDAVRLASIVRHIQHYNPEWEIDVTVPPGCETLFHGVCRQAFSINQDNPNEYSISRQISWPEPYEFNRIYPDSPSTIAEWVVRRVFRLGPVESLCRYEVNPTQEMHDRAAKFKELIGREFVVLHYRGNSVTQNKNPDEKIFADACRRILARGLAPVVLDFTGRSKLLEIPGVWNPGAGHPLWHGHQGGNGGQMVALISAAAGAIGIDSGPGHCMGATITPSLVLWLWHHPLQYYALAPNVTHLIPNTHEKLLYGGSDEEREAGLAYFQSRYRHKLCHNLRSGAAPAVEELLDAITP
jgi:hypothetical protein